MTGTLPKCFTALKDGDFTDDKVIPQQVYSLLREGAAIAKYCDITPLTPSSTRTASPFPLVPPSPAASAEAAPMASPEIDLSQQELGAPSPQGSLVVHVTKSNSPSASAPPAELFGEPVDMSAAGSAAATPSESPLPTPSTSLTPSGSPMMSVSPGFFNPEGVSPSGTPQLDSLFGGGAFESPAPSPSEAPITSPPASPQPSEQLNVTPSPSRIAQFYLTVDDVLGGASNSSTNENLTANNTTTTDSQSTLKLADVSLIDVGGEKKALELESTAATLLKDAAAAVSDNSTAMLDVSAANVQPVLLKTDEAGNATTNPLLLYAQGVNDERKAAFASFEKDVHTAKQEFESTVSSLRTTANGAAEAFRQLAHDRRKLALDALEKKAVASGTTADAVIAALKSGNETVKSSATDLLVGLIDTLDLQRFEADASMVVSNHQEPVQALVARANAVIAKISALFASRVNSVSADNASDEAVRAQLPAALAKDEALLATVTEDAAYAPNVTFPDAESETAMPFDVLGAMPEDAKTRELAAFEAYKVSQADRKKRYEAVVSSITNSATAFLRIVQQYIDWQKAAGLPITAHKESGLQHDAQVAGYQGNKTTWLKEADTLFNEYVAERNARIALIANESVALNASITERTQLLMGSATPAASPSPAGAASTTAMAEETATAAADGSNSTSTAEPESTAAEAATNGSNNETTSNSASENSNNGSNSSNTTPAADATAAATATTSSSPDTAAATNTATAADTAAPINTAAAPSNTAAEASSSSSSSPSLQSSSAAVVTPAETPAHNFRSLFDEQIVLTP